MAGYGAVLFLGDSMGGSGALAHCDLATATLAFTLASGLASRPHLIVRRLRLRGVLSTEQLLASRTYGLKGQPDAEVSAELVTGHNTVVAEVPLPFDLKTGKRTGHNAIVHEAAADDVLRGGLVHDGVCAVHGVRLLVCGGVRPPARAAGAGATTRARITQTRS